MTVAMREASLDDPAIRPTPGGSAASPDDTASLFAAARSGDRAAAERLVDATYRNVYAALFRFTGGDADLASDLTQETYRKAWESLASFR